MRWEGRWVMENRKAAQESWWEQKEAVFMLCLACIPRELGGILSSAQSWMKNIYTQIQKLKI
jgi:hypothetical protein